MISKRIKRTNEEKEDFSGGEREGGRWSNHCRWCLIDLFAFDCPLYNQLYGTCLHLPPLFVFLFFCIFVLLYFCIFFIFVFLYFCIFVLLYFCIFFVSCIFVFFISFIIFIWDCDLKERLLLFGIVIWCGQPQHGITGWAAWPLNTEQHLPHLVT